MSYSQLAIYVDEHLDLYDFVQTWLGHEIEVGNGSILISKTIKGNKEHH